MKKPIKVIMKTLKLFSLSIYSCTCSVSYVIVLLVVLNCFTPTPHKYAVLAGPTPQQEQDLMLLDALGRRQTYHNNNNNYESNSIIEILGKSTHRRCLP